MTETSWSSGRDRIGVSTSRCGRENPGSNPGHGKRAILASANLLSFLFSDSRHESPHGRAFSKLVFLSFFVILFPSIVPTIRKKRRKEVLNSLFNTSPYLT